MRQIIMKNLNTFSIERILKKSNKPLLHLRTRELLSLGEFIRSILG